MIAFMSMLVRTAVCKDDAKIVKQFVDPLLKADAMVGCVVGLFDGDSTQVRGYGEVHRGTADKPTGETIYEIGSMTKAFTGTLLADMVKRDLVKLDDPVQKYLPPNVTLHLAENTPAKLVDLASQSSGLPRMPDNVKPKDPRNPYADYTSERLFEFLNKHQLTRPPGKYEYSNLGMGLLGNLLGRKAGKSYEQLVVERICDPLHMSDTRITLSEDQKKRLAPPYNAELGNEENWDFDALAGAGAIRSNVNDLMKLIRASLDKSDKRPVVEAIHEAWKPHYGKKGEIGVGLGWHIARDSVTRWHNGKTAGYSSALFIHPPSRKAVVVLCNTASDATTPLAEKILQSLLGMSPEPVQVNTPITVAPAKLKQYEGTYALSLAFAITITLEKNRLMAQATGQDKFQIFPKSETDFFYKVIDAQISFEKGTDGKVTKLILHQNGRDLPGIKLPETAEKKGS
jgi:D-alanyl-D-alanine-carboxypeptidase/D-alanyl-D-alanine-endopeptidase